MQIAIIDSNNIIQQLYNSDQPLGAWVEFAVGLTPPCTAAEVADTAQVGDTYAVP
jgi:hypothetical protein